MKDRLAFKEDQALIGWRRLYRPSSRSFVLKRLQNCAMHDSIMQHFSTQVALAVQAVIRGALAKRWLDSALRILHIFNIGLAIQCVLKAKL